MISDDDDSQETNGKNGNSNGASASSSQSSSGVDDDMPASENVEARLDCLQRAFPKKDRLELLESLRAAKWDVNVAAKNIKSEGGGSEEFVPDEKPKPPAASAKKGSRWKKP